MCGSSCLDALISVRPSRVLSEEGGGALLPGQNLHARKYRLVSEVRLVDVAFNCRLLHSVAQ